LKINVLGTEYTITELSESEWEKSRKIEECFKDTDERVVKGLCLGYERKIYLKKNLGKHERRGVLRHEIIHAYQYESGVIHSINNLWDLENETDWLAWNIPKIARTFKELNILD